MKMKLDKTYIHSGKYYGAGEDVEVPDEAVEDLKSRVAAAAATAPALDSTAAGAQNPADGAGDKGESGSPSPDTMTKAELRAEAESRNLEVPAGATKAEIVAILEGK